MGFKTMNTHLHPMSSILFLSSLLIFFFFSSTLPSPSLAATRCHPDDYKVLMEIKKSLNNPYHLASWVPKTDCCTWYCLECDRTTNRVFELSLFAGNITGQIPSSVGDLPHLKTITFRKLINIYGSIPSSILKLKNLQSLVLDNNRLSGPIPDFLGQMTTLTFLDLSFNQFSGSIPPSLSNLNNLEALHLDRNKLTGPIPESFGKFTNPAPSLFLSHNQLSGPIPKSLSKLDFDTIDVSRNKLGGDGSMFFNPNGKRAYKIDLSRNLFEFDLTNIRFPVSLKYLDLSHNKIRGMIPEQLKSLELYGLNVSYNLLCGKIPFGGKMQSFDSSTYFYNKCLCGSPLGACKK